MNRYDFVSLSVIVIGLGLLVVGILMLTSVMEDTAGLGLTISGGLGILMGLVPYGLMGTRIFAKKAEIKAERHSSVRSTVV